MLFAQITITVSPEVASILALLSCILIGGLMLFFTWASISEEGKPAWFRLAGWLFLVPAAFCLLLSYGTGAKFGIHAYPLAGPAILTVGWVLLALSAILLVRTKRKKAALFVAGTSALLFALKPFIQPTLLIFKKAGKWQVYPIGTFAGYHLYFWGICLLFVVCIFLIWKGTFGEMPGAKDMLT